MRVILRCSELEGSLRAKEDELEVRCRVEGECIDLHTKLSPLRAELEQNPTQFNAPNDELVEATTELGRVDEARKAALAKVAAMEEAVCTLQ